jgi:MarR family transcriptional regulator, transcriptional regulator for hemolysin
MPPPAVEPIGVHLTRASKRLSRAFADVLAAAGASVPTWLVLVSLQGAAHGAQRQLADAVGIEGATLTHHLNRMEADGLVTRTRDPANRRAHKVALTAAGEALFLRLLGPVSEFDRQLRAGLSDHEVATLRALLDRLAANADGAAGTAAIAEAERSA